jgi:NAD(P)H-flavin reductase
MNNSFLLNQGIIKDVKPETTNTNTYTITLSDSKLQKDFYPIPGQFIMMSLFGAGESAISLSDTSKNGSIVTTIRNVGSVTNSILSLKKGDYIGIRGPYGNGWPLEKNKKKDVLLISGGMGIAPLRGVINYIKNNRKDFGFLEILYGARTPEDMIFTDEFDKWRKIRKSRLELTVDSMPVASEFECQLGLVTSCFPRMKTKPKNSVAFICGPEIMMRYAAKCLETIGFKENQIFLSLERRMKCGIGKCGHCQVGLKFVCKDGPIFSYNEIKPFIHPL